MPDPIYTVDNCDNPAYQLNWSYSVFWHRRPKDFSWLDDLKQLSERDHIRILQHEYREPNISQFLLSMRPLVKPLTMVQRTKGRLQHLIRDAVPRAFRRNYGLRSIGSTNRERLAEYLTDQLNHHPMVEPRVNERLSRFQIHDPQVDLYQPRRTSHAQYWYNLHVVMINDQRYMELRDDALERLQQTIVNASRLKSHWLSRAAILPDHIHLALGCQLEESPAEVALSYLNNLAYAAGMREVYRHGYYVGTFSEYDLGVIPRRVENSAVR